ncbi:MAG: hypothetical protein ACREUT_08275 [Steroidobacteraceae bacterium]
MRRREFLAGTLGTLGTSGPVITIAASTPCPPPTVALTRSAAVGTPCALPSSASPEWLKGAGVYQWINLPSLSASSVLPNPLPPGITGVASVTDAWGGGALRQNGSYYILHGGGHGDYSGNEIYVLQLSLDNPQWVRIWGPTPNAQIVQDQYYYNDSPPSPASVHTYYSLMYDDQDDVLMRFMKGQYTLPDYTGGIDGIKWGAASWEQNQKNAIWPLPPPSFLFSNGQCKDGNGNVYMVNSWNRFMWNRQANSWSTPIAKSPYAVQSSGCCFDSKRGVVWSFGGSYGGGSIHAGKAYSWNVQNNSEALITLSGPNAGAIDGVNANFSGAVYDPIIDLVFVMPGDGYIYSFDPMTYRVTQIVTTGPALPQTNASSGTAPWNKLQYVPELGGVVIQPLWKAQTFFMRTH